MKFSLAQSAALLALFPAAAMANFDVYHGTQIDLLGAAGAETMWLIFEAEPDCDNVNSDGSWWYESEDVSGDQTGVRCEGTGCTSNEEGEAGDIDVLEMNFHGTDPVYHFSKCSNHPHATSVPVLVSSSGTFVSIWV